MFHFVLTRVLCIYKGEIVVQERMMQYVIYDRSSSDSLMATRYAYFFHCGRIDSYSSRGSFNRSSGKSNYWEEDALVDVTKLFKEERYE